MTDFNMDNLNTVVVDEKKVGPSKQNARVKCIIDQFILTAELASGDEFLMNSIPESAIILDAYVKISASLGASGILDMGIKEYIEYDTDLVIAEDLDSLVSQADGGGQAVLKRSDLSSVGLLKQIGKGGAQPFLRASEVSTAGIGKTVQAVVTYLLP